MRSIRAAVVFLTRIPVGIGPGEPPAVATAVPWFPTVGLAIGATCGALYAGVWHTSTPTISAVVAVAAAVLMTGAFHLDGLGDIADGFAGGTTTERRLEIMRDSRLGTYGVAAVALALLAQVVGLSTFGPLAGFVALSAAHGLGRAAALALMLIAPPARSDGLGVDYLHDLHRGRTLAGAIVAPLAVVAVAGLAGVAAVAAAVVVIGVLRRWSRLAIGGISGDVLGGVEQLVEVSTLLVLASFVAEGMSIPWWR